MSKPLVLLTGVTGFLATHVLDQLLRAGFQVRGTARSISRAQETLKRMSPHLPEGLENKVEFVEISDLVTADYTTALKGVAAVVHTASPFHFNVKDNVKDLLEPAIEGTLNIMRQAHKLGINRFVITSSCASVFDITKGYCYRDYTYTDKDWSPFDWAIGSDPASPPGFVYGASKTLAEKAAWKYANENGMQLAVINPPLIYGPVFQPPSSAAGLNTSNQLIWHLIAPSNGPDPKELPADRLPIFVDVRDVALAHVRALENIDQGAAGRRYITSAGHFFWAEAVEHLRKVRPGLKDRLPVVPQGWKKPDPVARMDTSLANEFLGMKEFISWQKTLKDSVDNLLEMEKNVWSSSELIHDL